MFGSMTRYQRDQTSRRTHLRINNKCQKRNLHETAKAVGDAADVLIDLGLQLGDID